ncbi:hypothetical protein RBA41_13370 [Massilia sp. CCM 9210]|uniref:hypothetical protein n=1 Tax=Massilia scottii TaxID=3057166 RepID=UPI002796AF5B|nr:hypothetical protein [Massilia sp. CCM 9210]MDQ1814299.1 hypothetical protein [Massilia sp. CCM 9210]
MPARHASAACRKCEKNRLPASTARHDRIALLALSLVAGLSSLSTRALAQTTDTLSPACANFLPGRLQAFHHAGAAFKEYLDEYKRIGTELVADAEMSMNKRYVAGGYLISNQMQRAVAGTLANNWLVGLPSEFLGQYVPLIQKVTPEQVREMGKKYFAPELQSVVVVGDNAAVAEQLKQYGEFTVQEK